MTAQQTSLPVVSEMANDADMLELIEMFVEDLPKRAAALEQALREGELSALSRIAHQLKGAAGGYGFPTITEAAAELEQCAKASSDLSRLELEVRRVADLCVRARATLPEE